jgi:hypothetical protein
MSAIAFANDRGKFEKRKHIDVCHHKILECVKANIIKTVYIPSKENIADIFTKPLSDIQFNYLLSKITGEK